MLGQFPTPYPDEMFYSLCARYSDRVRYPGARAVSYELFGGQNPSSAIELSVRLGHLLSILPSGHLHTLDSLMNNHTFFPFVSPFLPLHRANKIRDDMGRLRPFPLNSHLVTKTSVRLAEWFRFCPKCVKSDRKKFGECYWHRVHQVFGVEVCPDHSVFLENSKLPTDKHINCGIYMTAEDFVILGPSRSTDISSLCHEILFILAKDVQWLLNQSGLYSKQPHIRQSYLMLLSERGLATHSGVIRSDSLSKAFREFYPPELLQVLQCDIAEGRSNWHLKITRKYDNSKSPHPLRHILLIRLLGHTVESFFETVIERVKTKASTVFKPFGEGPWPCLNPTCSNFRKFKIKAYQISRSYRGSLIGIFTCVCEFAYSREVSDKYINNPYIYQCVMVRGHAWETTLRKLWQDSSLSLTKIAYTLGVGEETVKRYAVRLGLAFPRKWTGPGSRLIRMDSEIQARILKTQAKRSPAAKLKLRDSYRKKWLSAIKKHPGVGRGKLSRQIATDAYMWLRVNDLEWLKEHMPAALKTGGQLSRIDWKARDVELAAQVRNSSERLKNSKNTFGRPVKITRNLIAQDIKQSGVLLNDAVRDKLPKTFQALSKFTETTAEFAIRRVEWAAECFQQEGVSAVAGWKLALRAGVSWETRHIPIVKAAIDEACEALQNLDRNAISNAA